MTAAGDNTGALDILSSGLDEIWRAEPGIALSCARAFLVICQQHRQDGAGVPVLALARLLATPRTNVTRHLIFLRRIGWVETVHDPKDQRIDLNAPTVRGAEIYRSLGTWPRS